MKPILTIHKTIVVLFAFLIFSSQLHAGKVYQWVDEDGKKHFSQTPPPDNKQPKTIVKTGSVSMQPREAADGTYCGELRVAYNKRKSSRSSQSSNMAGNVSKWKASLKRAEERLNEYITQTNERRVIRHGESTLRNSSSYIANKEKLSKKVNQYRCAIYWAQHGSSSRPDTKTLEEKYIQAKENYAVAAKQQKKICGKEPPRYNQYGPERDAYQAWEKCQRKYNAVVRKMEDELIQLKKAYWNAK